MFDSGLLASVLCIEMCLLDLMVRLTSQSRGGVNVFAESLSGSFETELHACSRSLTEGYHDI